MLEQPDPADVAQLVTTVAANIKALRAQKGWSLGQLATQAGVGKSTLSMLEAGKANPSIETLWAVAAALGVPFGLIIEPRPPEVRIVRNGEGVKVAAEASEIMVRLLSSSHRRGTFEVYVMEGEPGEAHHADAHIKGCIEHIMVLTGRMSVGPTDAPANLAAGDLAVFAGDEAHVYEPLEPGTRAVMVMDYE